MRPFVEPGRPARAGLLTLLVSAALFALPVADALAAPKPRVKFQNKVTVVQENAADGFAHVVVTRARQLDTSVSVQYTTSSTSATAGASCGGAVDFVPVAGTLTFGPHETSKEILVPICDDTGIEGGEFVNVALTRAGAGVIVAGGGSQIAIADNDGSTRLAFASTDPLVFESNGPAQLSVIRLGDPNPAVSVDYTLSDGTATAGNDYVQSNGTLNFPSISADATGSALQKISVGLVDDASAEVDEDMSVSLSNARVTATGDPLPGGVSTPSQSTVTILDDDTPASIAFADASATVGEADGSVTVTLRRSGAPDDSVSASYTTVDGTALAGWDYTFTAFDVDEPGADPLFGPDEVEVSFSVPITDDALSEGNEAFGLELSGLQSSSGPVGISTRPSMDVAITDDEPAPSGGTGGSSGSTTAPLPAGSTGTSGSNTTTTAYAPRLKVLSRRVRVRRRKTARVRVKCLASAGKRCKGRLTLRTRSGRKLGTARFSVRRGRSVVRVGLSRRAKAALRRHARIRAKATAISRAVGARSVRSSRRLVLRR